MSARYLSPCCEVSTSILHMLALGFVLDHWYFEKIVQLVVRTCCLFYDMSCTRGSAENSHPISEADCN